MKIYCHFYFRGITLNWLEIRIFVAYERRRISGCHLVTGGNTSAFAGYIFGEIEWIRSKKKAVLIKPPSLFRLLRDVAGVYSTGHESMNL